MSTTDLRGIYMEGWDRGRDVGRLLGRGEAFGEAAGELRKAAQMAIDKCRRDEAERLVAIAEGLILCSSQALNQVPR